MLAKSWQTKPFYAPLSLPAWRLNTYNLLIYNKIYGGEGGIRTLAASL